MNPGDRMVFQPEDELAVPVTVVSVNQATNRAVIRFLSGSELGGVPSRWLTPTPNARRTDPDTSHAAAARSTTRAGADRDLVLRVLADHPAGLTDFELAAHAGRQQTSLGVRRGELRDSGLVESAGVTRPSPSGSAAQVWRLTAAGWARVDRGAA